MAAGRILALAGTLALPASAQAPASAGPSSGTAASLLMWVDATGTHRPVETPRDWEQRRRQILDQMQLVMGPLPDASRKVPLDLHTYDTRQLGKVTLTRVSFATEPADRVPAWLLVPPDPGHKLPAILCLHQTTAIGKDEPAGLGNPENPPYALELATRGYVTLAPDYPGFGDYRCDPYRLGYASATMKGIWNHMRAVDLLQSLPGVDPSRIGCIGHSLGGHNTLFLAAFDTRVRAMVSSCGFTAFANYANGNLAGWSHNGYMPRIATTFANNPRQMPFDFPEVLATLAPRPLFVHAPRRDANFDLSGAAACIAAALPVYHLLGAPHALVASHPDTTHAFNPADRNAAYRFLDNALGHHTPTPKTPQPAAP